MLLLYGLRKHHNGGEGVEVIILIAYILGFLISWRKAFNFNLDEFTYVKPEPMDVIMSIFIATPIASVWFIWFPPMFIYFMFLKPLLQNWIDKKELN